MEKNSPITFNYTFKLLTITFKTIENSLYIQRTLELSTADLQRYFWLQYSGYQLSISSKSQQKFKEGQLS